MHSDDMTNEVSEFLRRADELQRRKNPDYHPDKIAMLEVLHTAWECGITVEQDLWSKVKKQLAALRRYVIEGHVESESPESRMLDVAVYMGMLSFWNKHQKQILYDAYAFVSHHRRCERDPPETCHYLTRPEDICDRCKFQSWLGAQCRAYTSRSS